MQIINLQQKLVLSEIVSSTLAGLVIAESHCGCDREKSKFFQVNGNFQK